jgi:hypothetical protein
MVLKLKEHSEASEIGPKSIIYPKETLYFILLYYTRMICVFYITTDERKSE